MQCTGTGAVSIVHAAMDLKVFRAKAARPVLLQLVLDQSHASLWRLQLPGCAAQGLGNVGQVPCTKKTPQFSFCAQTILTSHVGVPVRPF